LKLIPLYENTGPINARCAGGGDDVDADPGLGVSVALAFLVGVIEPGSIPLSVAGTLVTVYISTILQALAIQTTSSNNESREIGNLLTKLPTILSSSSNQRAG
jgi:hypothetical protein